MSPDDRKIISSIVFADMDMDGNLPDGYVGYLAIAGDETLAFVAKIVIDKNGVLDSYLLCLYPKAGHSRLAMAVRRNQKKIHRLFNKWIISSTNLMLVIL